MPAITESRNDVKSSIGTPPFGARIGMATHSVQHSGEYIIHPLLVQKIRLHFLPTQVIIAPVSHGDVAQLGEHQVRNLGVESSILFVSTISMTKRYPHGYLLFIL